MSGTVRMALTSWVAAAFIAEVTSARFHLSSGADKPLEVLIEEVDPHHGTVAAEVVVRGCKAVGDGLVPVGHGPVGGIDALGVLASSRKPFHSYSPLPLVGRPGSTSLFRFGSRPAVYSATWSVSM